MKSAGGHVYDKIRNGIFSLQLWQAAFSWKIAAAQPDNLSDNRDVLMLA